MREARGPTYSRGTDMLALNIKELLSSLFHRVLPASLGWDASDVAGKADSEQQILVWSGARCVGRVTASEKAIVAWLDERENGTYSFGFHSSPMLEVTLSGDPAMRAKQASRIFQECIAHRWG